MQIHNDDLPRKGKITVLLIPKCWADPIISVISIGFDWLDSLMRQAVCFSKCNLLLLAYHKAAVRVKFQNKVLKWYTDIASWFDSSKLPDKKIFHLFTLISVVQMEGGILIFNIPNDTFSSNKFTVFTKVFLRHTMTVDKLTMTNIQWISL